MREDRMKLRKSKVKEQITCSYSSAVWKFIACTYAWVYLKSLLFCVFFFFLSTKPISLNGNTHIILHKKTMRLYCCAMLLTFPFIFFFFFILWFHFQPFLLKKKFTVQSYTCDWYCIMCCAQKKEIEKKKSFDRNW